MKYILLFFIYIFSFVTKSFCQEKRYVSLIQNDTSVLSVIVPTFVDLGVTLKTSKKLYQPVKETKAVFSKGDKEWQYFIYRNLRDDMLIFNGAPTGAYYVIISFVVEKDGKLSSFKPLSNNGFGMEEEAIRVLKKSPLWLPAYYEFKKANKIEKEKIRSLIVQIFRFKVD